MFKKSIFLATTAVLLSGCAAFQNTNSRHKLHVRIKAKPETAKLYMNGSLYSDSAHKDLYITLTEEELQQGTYILDIPEARWPSSTRVPQTTQTLFLDAMTQTITIQHPNTDSTTGQFDQRKNQSIAVRFESSPPGARVYINGAEGKTPFTQTTSLSLKDFERGFVTIPSAEARWPSGTTTATGPVTISLDSSPDHHTITLTHPVRHTAAGQFDAMKSHTVTIQFYSEPNRALIFNDHENLNRTPVHKTYTYSLTDFERGYMLIPSMQARWTSGAQTNSGTIKVDLNRTTEHEHTFIRPEYPNLSIDLAVIQQEENNRTMRQQEEERQALLKEHHQELEQIEKDKLLLEQQKLELLKKKQKADEKYDREMIHLRKLEIEKNLKHQSSYSSTNSSYYSAPKHSH